MENSRTVEANIKVFARFRPLSAREIATSPKAVQRKQSQTAVTVRSLKEGEWLSFSYDGVFEADAAQKEVYERAARPVVGAVLEGFNGTILAYGQTASGKTHSMYGPPNHSGEQLGIIPRAVPVVRRRLSTSSSRPARGSRCGCRSSSCT